MKNLFLFFLMIIIFLSLLDSKDERHQKNFMLVFQVYDYTSEIKDAVNYFFEHVFQKGDQLVVVTPLKLYGYSKQSLLKPRAELLAEILKRLKADISAGTAKYRNLFDEMNGIVKSLDEESFILSLVIDSYLQKYKNVRENLKIERRISENMLLRLSQVFRGVKGENYLLLVYQEELRPIPNKTTMSELNRNKKYSNKATEIFLTDKYQAGIDVEKVVSVLNNSSITLHFLYLRNKMLQRGGKALMLESSGDIYSELSRIAKATKGIILTSTNPSVFLENINKIIIEEEANQISKE